MNKEKKKEKNSSHKKQITEKHLLYYIQYLEKLKIHERVDFFLKHQVSKEYVEFFEKYSTYTFDEFKNMTEDSFVFHSSYQWIVIRSNFFYRQRNNQSNIKFEFFVSFFPFADNMMVNLKDKKDSFNEFDESWGDILCILGPYTENQRLQQDLDALKRSGENVNECLSTLQQLLCSHQYFISIVIIWWLVPPIILSNTIFHSFGLVKK